ncbi:hypothetical protein E4631_15350 [Hymenobacter sp. UV11]|uniref:hypothetical protein n=1 Tax=Hymenobacter sp. UV11 TaxID=1849735 RepID=UPI00105DEC50|nr:hypothetical protein [Hymenobacter sp. UV11]TFZ65596.1 hypothetical protein E4631_15350 [Hymenobacter sp. UV11]
MTRFLLGGPALLHALALGGPARQQLLGQGASTITLLVLNQAPCTVPTPRTVIQAKLAYHLAAGEQSDYGFAVSIKFQTTTPGRTYSEGELGIREITRRSDTLTIRYPLAAVWADARLRRPITCYFYLHRNTAPGRSRVVAQTPAIIFQECQ